MIFLLCVLPRESDIEDEDEESESPLEEDDQEPEIILPLRNKKGKTGGSVKMACRVFCPVEMEVEWFKGMRAITQGPRYVFEHEDDLYSLTINNLRPSDGGNYRAVFSNKYGSVKTKAELDIEGAFFIDDMLKNEVYCTI